MIKLSLCLVFGFFAVFGSSSAYAEDTVQVDGHILHLNGRGVRIMTIFNIRVFEGSLYLEKPLHSSTEIIESDQIKMMRLKFLRDVSGNQFQNGSIDEFDKNCAGKPCEVFRPKIQEMSKLYTDVKEGEYVDYTYFKDRVRVSVRGAKRGEIQGKDFVRYLLNGWVGDRAKADDLKEKLIGSNTQRAISATN